MIILNLALKCNVKEESLLLTAAYVTNNFMLNQSER